MSGMLRSHKLKDISGQLVGVRDERKKTCMIAQYVESICLYHTSLTDHAANLGCALYLFLQEQFDRK